MPPSAPESSSSRQSDTVVESGDDIRIPLTISPADEHNTIESAPSPRTALAASLYARTERLNAVRVKAEFEQSLLFLLTLNVLYMYYVDHKLLILFIRVSQVVRLLYFPYVSLTGQRGTALLLLVSNIAVLLIHAISILRGEDVGPMLFINFIGEEPKSALKLIFVDVLIVMLQSMLLQCKWESTEIRILSSPPVPVNRAASPLLSPTDDSFSSNSPEPNQGPETSPS